MQPKETQNLSNKSNKFNNKYCSSLKGSITKDEMQLIFIAKCQDFDIIPTPKLFERFLNHQSKKPFKKVFDMSRCALGKGSAAILANILFAKHLLKIVDISSNNIGDRGAYCFSKLILHSNSIISMNLSSNSITDIGAEFIFSAMVHNKHIISLNLGSDNGVGRNSIGPKAVQALKTMLQTNKILSELDISMTEITWDMVTPIAQGIRQNSALQYFNISNNNIQSKGVNALLKACSKSKIKVLNMANNHIRDDSTQAFVNYLSSNRYIETFDLSGNYLTKTFISGISNQLKSSSIITLNLNNNPLRSEGIASLGRALNGDCNMKNLSVVNCQIETKGFTEFCDLISGNTSLVSLHLGHNSTLDEGAIRFSHVIKRHPSLKDIDLEMCEITEEGGKLLFSAFAQSQSIRRINVKNNLIRDGTIIQKCLNENPRIFYVNIDYNTIEYKTQMEIQRLVNENIKRWKNGQKNRVKDEVVKLAEMNGYLADARQSIIEEREFISVLKNRIAESEEFQEQQKVTNEKSSIELNDKYNQVTAVVNEYLLKSQTQKDELRAQANRMESDISNISHRIENLGQSLKQNYISLQTVDHKITDIKKKQNSENDTLTIQYINAKNHYKDMKELFLEAWRKAQEEKRQIKSEERKKRQQEEAMSKAAGKNKSRKGSKKTNQDQSDDQLDTKRTTDSGVSNESHETKDSSISFSTNKSNANINSNLSALSELNDNASQESGRTYESNESDRKDQSFQLSTQIDELTKSTVSSSKMSEKVSNKSTSKNSQSTSVTPSGRNSSTNQSSSAKNRNQANKSQSKNAMNKNQRNKVNNKNEVNDKSKSSNTDSKVQSNNASSKVQSSNVNSKVQSSNVSSKVQSSNVSSKVQSSNASSKAQSGINTAADERSPNESENHSSRSNVKVGNEKSSDSIQADTSTGVLEIADTLTSNSKNGKKSNENNKTLASKNKLTPQSPGIRSQSQQGTASPLKKPKIVIPVPKVQQGKRSQVQSPKQPLSYQSQVIPEPMD